MSATLFMAPNKWQSYFKRLRDEEPVHYLANSPFGPFWSITRYEDILFVDKAMSCFQQNRPLFGHSTRRLSR